VGSLAIAPETQGEQLSGNTDRVIANRESIEEHLSERLEEIREGQVEEVFSGGGQSATQEMLLDMMQMRILPQHGDQPAPVDAHETVSEWTNALFDRLDRVKLEHTDEDRVLRETFREHPDYTSLGDWPVEEFLVELESFIEDNIEASAEYQTTLVGESAVQARLICWGVIGQ